VATTAFLLRPTVGLGYSLVRLPVRGFPGAATSGRTVRLSGARCQGPMGSLDGLQRRQH